MVALEKYGEGKCINCGFLGKRESRFTISLCYEASAVDRLSGNFTEYGGLRTHVCCFLGKRMFFSDLEKLGLTDQTYSKIQEFITDDRKCEYWYQWTEFVSPKEHYEEYKMMKLEQDRNRFELRMQRWNDRRQKKTDCIVIWLTAGGIIFALAQVFVALASLTSDSIIFKWFH
jgi:hypothetical protein